MKSISSKRFAVILLGLLILCPIGIASYPQRADATGQPVFDIANFVKNTITSVQTHLVAVTSVHTLLKDTALDPLAWVVSKAALQSVVKSMVNWAGHGFNGSPSFVTDLNKQMQSVGDTAANGFLSQLATNGSLKSPWQTSVASFTKTNYGQSTASNGFFAQNAFTLGKVSPNPTTAMNGGMFTQQGGGLNTWLSAWSNPQNNPFGASILAANGLNSQVGSAQDTQKTELSWGQGFLSSRGSCPTTTTGGTTSATASSSTVSLSGLSSCLSKPIQTLGSTAKAAFDKSVGSGIDTLVSAHTFDEIITSLLGQLVNQVVTSGLTGLSQPSSSTGGTTYFNQTDPTQVALSNNLSTTFSTTIAGQITQLQKFQTEWTLIQTAAQNAQTALQHSTCPNIQTTITNQIQPTLNQAATSLAEASTSLAAIQAIQAKIPSPNSTTDQTAAVATISTQYNNLLQTDPLLADTNAMQNAETQTIDTSADPSQPQSLLSQMNLIAQTASSPLCVRIGT